MRKRKQALILMLLAISSMPSQSEQVSNKRPALKDTEITEDLKQFSRQMVEQKPLLREVLNKAGVDYLYQLDPKKTYRIMNKLLMSAYWAAKQQHRLPSPP